MIAPHRGNRSKPPTQDRRRLSRYMRRWLVERFFAWIQWQRRILIRWEYHAHNFLGCPTCLPRHAQHYLLIKTCAVIVGELVMELLESLRDLIKTLRRE